MITYKCLILDHDDTIVDSTKTIHYPAFLETLATLRPSQQDLSFSDFITMCHTLGFEKICDEVYHFDADEMKTEYAIWKDHVQRQTPLPFEGITEILQAYVNQGGLIAVVSHSESTEIKRDYLTHFGFEPHLVYGWELGPQQRKPNPYPLLQILDKLSLKPQECLVLDDMRLGKEMAQALKVDFAYAGWANQTETIRNDMKDSSFILEKVDDLKKLIFK